MAAASLPLSGFLTLQFFVKDCSKYPRELLLSCPVCKIPTHGPLATRRWASTQAFQCQEWFSRVTLVIVPAESVYAPSPRIRNGVRIGIDYGLNRVRFPAPVRAGEKIRARFALRSLVKVDGGFRAVFEATADVQRLQKGAAWQNRSSVITPRWGLSKRFLPALANG